MTKQRTTTSSLWSRTTKALGKFWAGVISLPEDRRQTVSQRSWTDYTRFPPF
jgi:hypothetical protein